MSCPHAAFCSGCDDWDASPEEQRRSKTAAVLRGLQEELGPEVSAALPEPAWIAPTPRGRGRQRLEFQIRGRKIGLFAKQAAPDGAEARELVDLDVCHQATPELEDWLRTVRALLPPLARAGVRLRVSPEGLRGIWLDLPNEQVKAVLEEKAALEKLLAAADAVEIGQRRKPVVRAPDGRLKLSKEPALRPWTRTWAGATPVPLLSTIGDFSQPSDLCNREIAVKIAAFAQGSRAILEFGCGNGNLSIPALTGAEKLLGVEREERLARAAQANLEEARRRVPALARKEFEIRNAWLDERAPEFEGYDTYLLNPAREGAGKFLERGVPRSVRKVIMMSCHLESYAKDAAILAREGFHCQEWSLLDQFPQTRHIEILSRWQRGEPRPPTAEGAPATESR